MWVPLPSTPHPTSCHPGRLASPVPATTYLKMVSPLGKPGKTWVPLHPLCPHGQDKGRERLRSGRCPVPGCGGEAGVGKGLSAGSRLPGVQQIFPRLLAECSSSCPSCLPGPPASTQKKAHLARGLRSNLGLLTIHTAPHHTLSSCPPTGSSSLNGVCLSQLPRVGSALLFLQLGHCLLARVLEGSIPAPRSGLRPPQSWGATYTIQPCLPSLIFYKIPTADKPAFLCYHLILSLFREGRGQG